MNYATRIKNMYTHSFAINPFKYQPSGTRHFDKTCTMKNTINNKIMLEHGLDCKLVIMYNKYDVLKIYGGKCFTINY